MVLKIFYCIVIHSSPMLYMIGIKEISFLRIPSLCKLHGVVITHAVLISE